MNPNVGYSQFIYGKFEASQDSGYMLVARTADLTDEERLKTMVEKTHRFWGGRPPERDNIRAAGVFLQDNNLVLVQAATAVNSDGDIVFSGDRDFNQYRYVFIPIDSVSGLQGRTFQLLYWILKQLIPLQHQFNANLPPLQIPLLEQPMLMQSREQEVDKIQRGLRHGNIHESWLLSMQDALINGQRLLLTVNDTIKPEDFLESMLLLLPAACRSKVSVAVGTVDEQHCGWAQLIIKFNDSPQGKLPNNLIWLNLSKRKFERQFNQNSFQSDYVNLIKPITEAPEKVPQLLQQLNAITDNAVTLENIAEPKILVRLIPLLPNDRQDAMRRKYLSGLSQDDWQTIIPLVNDADQKGLLFAWYELEQATIAHPQQYAPSMIEVWKRLLPNEIVNLLYKLKENLLLAEILLDYGLIQKSANQPQEVVQELVKLCVKVIANKSLQNVNQSWEFVKKLLSTSSIFEKASDRLELLNAAFPEAIRANAEVLIDPDYSRIILDLVPALPDPLQDNVWQKYLSQLDRNQWESAIPDIHVPQGLVVVWRNLGISTSKQPQDYAPLMFEVWKRLSGVEQIRLLQQLQQNLHLADILLKYGLLEQPRSEDENTAVVQELITLCKKIVAHKSLPDWNHAWQVATHFATKKIFQDKTEHFWLLDTAFTNPLPVQLLYNCFNVKFATLLPHIEATKIQQSNLYKQLTQNAQVADLLNTLFMKRNAAIKNLPQLANLTGMNDVGQDNLYAEFLEIWNPSYEEARNLLVSLIQLRCYSFKKTLTWFETKKPGICEIFSDLQHTPIAWNTWDRLAVALYANPEESVVFLDSVVEENFLTQVLQRWLPIIAEDENARRRFLENSRAWQLLQSQHLSIRVASLPKYVTTLINCLVDSGRSGWLNGDLLYYLCHNWISHKQVDLELLNLVTSPTVTKAFSNQDWLQLQTAIWNLGIEIKLPSERPVLTEKDKKLLWNIAIESVKPYTQPEQTQRLLNDCVTWGLGLAEQTEILKAAPSQALSIDLILNYLGRDGKAIISERKFHLLELLLQIKPSNQIEIANLEKISGEALYELVSAEDWDRIKWWGDIAFEQEVYTQVFTLAVQKCIQQYPLNKLLNSLQQISNYSMLKESELMIKALRYSIPDSGFPLLIKYSK